MDNNELNQLMMQNILHNLDEGIHVIDDKGITIFYNVSMAKVEGIERQEVLNKDFLDIFPSLDQHTSTLLVVLKTGQAISNRVQTYLNYKGEKVTTVNSTIPLVKENKVIGALEIAKDITKIKELSEQILELHQELASKKNKDSGIKKKKNYTFENIIGISKSLHRSIEFGKRAALSKSTVLIYGETGTGKELFAQSIHYSGSRREMPFIAQNCAALPESLLEGILFGTVKGSFTGAVDRPGLFEQANGGTLLLDEINSMGPTLQSKLLRVLQEGYIRRVGGTKDIPIDVRIIATTNELPKNLIDDGKLRKDLYYRLCVLNIEIPPLRNRKDDIKILSSFFMKKYNDILNKNIYIISDEVMDIFNNYEWPGDVRELENIIEGSINLALYNENILTKDHLPNYLLDNKFQESHKLYANLEDKSLPEILTEIEKKLILDKLKENDYNVSTTAKTLGIKRQTLQHKVKKYEIIKI